DGLLYGPNKKAGNGGENAANYENPEFDRLFKKMANMENSPARLELLGQILAIARKNAPWIWGLHPKSFALYHNWLKNVYPNLMANNTLKYKRITPDERFKSQNNWNRPVLWPLFLSAAIGTLFLLPGLFQYFRRNAKEGMR
ncbi:MAG: peptide ABC transporter substrate-binding protein, partial [Nitrospinota bacterium]